MAYNPTNPNGQATSANSTPVVIASDNTLDVSGNDVVSTGTITAGDSATASRAGQGGQNLLSGTPTANSAVVLSFPTINGNPESFSNVVIAITGTFVGTWVLERSPDNGTTWTSFSCFIAGLKDLVNTGTLEGMFHGNVAGTTNIRVRCTSYTSGTMNVRITSGIGTGTVTVGNPLRLYDLINKVEGTIKPASTAAVATDTALVVSVSPNTTMNTTSTPSTTGGWNVFHLVSAASTNATNIKSTFGQVGGWFIYNSNAAARKVAFHNTSGIPTAGSGVLFSIIIPPSSGANVEFSNGIGGFSSGIAITTTTGLTDADNAAVAASDLVINIFYK
jgi:hypothetical protein